MTTPIVRPNEEIRCRAPHPARDKHERFRGRRHGVLLPARVPFDLRFVRLVERLDEVRTDLGRIGISCVHKDCRAVHEFEVIYTRDVAA